MAVDGGSRTLAAALALGLLLDLGAAAAREARLPSSRAEVDLSFAPLVKMAAPAVVNIYTRRVQRVRPSSPLFNDPFFRRFFGDAFGFDRPRERVQNSLGSGVIVHPEGMIVTNHHVIEGAEGITVVLADRREFDATILGTDERTDLAVLTIDSKGGPMPYLKLRDSDELQVGDLVLAIGNPFGVGQTVTSGIVSALARTQVGTSDINFFIQTDAAINPGNSGGALVTMDGKLAGINSAIFSKSGGSHGIGFSIPANMVRSVIAGLTSPGGRMVRPWFGATGQGVTAEIASSLGMERPTGVLVNDVYRGGPADRARLRVGDVVLSVNGREVADADALEFRVATLTIGETAKLAIWRRGRERTLTIELREAPEIPPRETMEIGESNPFAGATVANMSPALAEELSLTSFEPGVVVLELRGGSTADRLGFRPGDMVASVNGHDVDSVNRLKRLLAQRTDRWRVTIKRGGQTLSMVVNR